MGDAAAGAPSGGAALALAGRFVREHVAIDRPLLLRGLLRDPVVLGAWRRRRVLSRGGDLRFQVMQYRGDGSLAEAHTWRRVALRRWVGAEMRAPPPKWPEYIFDQSADAGGDVARADAAALPWRALLHAAPHALYVGANGSGNPCHYHQQTWNALVAGRKRWTLHPPNATFYSELHPRRWLGKAARLADASSGALQCEQRLATSSSSPSCGATARSTSAETVGVATPFSCPRRRRLRRALTS